MWKGFTPDNLGDFKRELNSAVLKDMRSNKDSISVTVLAVDITRKESEDVKNGADYDSPESKLITSESNLVITWPLLSFFSFCWHFSRYVRLPRQPKLGFLADNHGDASSRCPRQATAGAGLEVRTFSHALLPILWGQHRFWNKVRFLFFYRTFYDVKSLGVVTSSASEFRGSAFESHLFWVEFESPPPRLCGLSPVLFILMNLFFCQIHGGLQCGRMLLDRTSERPIQSPWGKKCSGHIS